MIPKKRLGEMLIDAGVIDETQLKAALGHQRQWGIRIGQALVDLKLASEADIVRALAQKYGFEVARLGALEPYALEQALKLVPREFALRNNVFPMAADTATILVAMSDPTNLAVVDEIRFRTGRRVNVCIGGDREVAEALLRAYPGDGAVEAIALDLDSDESETEAVFEPFGGGSKDALEAFFGGGQAEPPAAPASEEAPAPAPLPVAPPAPASPPAPARAAPQPGPAPGRAPSAVGAPASGTSRAAPPTGPPSAPPRPGSSAGAPPPGGPRPPGAVAPGAPGAHPVAAPSRPSAPAPAVQPPTSVPAGAQPRRPAPPAPPPSASAQAAPSPAAGRVPPASATAGVAALRPVELALEEPDRPPGSVPAPSTGGPARSSDGAVDPVRAEGLAQARAPGAPGAREPPRPLTAREVEILESLDRLAGGGRAEPEIVKPTQAIAALVRLLLRKQLITEQELLDELTRK